MAVQPTGTRSWVQRIVVCGLRRDLGLGAAALVTLAEARELALANRRLARSGGGPLSEKRRAEGSSRVELRLWASKPVPLAWLSPSTARRIAYGLLGEVITLDGPAATKIRS